MFDYDVATEEQAIKDRYSLLPDGEYDGIIVKCESRMSNSGNNMFDMTIALYDDAGAQIQVRDFLIFTKKMMWKVIHAMDSAGLTKEYEEKKIYPELMVNQNVRVLAAIQKGSLIPEDKLGDRPVGSVYPDKNVISDYIKRSEQAPKKTEKANDFIDDPLPF